MTVIFLGGRWRISAHNMEDDEKERFANELLGEFERLAQQLLVQRDLKILAEQTSCQAVTDAEEFRVFGNGKYWPKLRPVHYALEDQAPFNQKAFVALKHDPDRPKRPTNKTRCKMWAARWTRDKKLVTCRLCRQGLEKDAKGAQKEQNE